MSKSIKQKRESEFKKVQTELKMLAGKPNGWIKVDKKLKEKNDVLIASDIKSLRQWIVKEKDTRKTALKVELSTLNEFFELYKEHPESQIQVELYKKKVLVQGSPMYDNLLEAQEVELEEQKIKLSYGFVSDNYSFKYMADNRWQELMVKITVKKKKALEMNIKDLKEIVEETKKEIQEEKVVNDKRVAQIKEELKELGEKFPKDELSYIG